MMPCLFFSVLFYLFGSVASSYHPLAILVYIIGVGISLLCHSALLCYQ